MNTRTQGRRSGRVTAIVCAGAMLSPTGLCATTTKRNLS